METVLLAKWFVLLWIHTQGLDSSATQHSLSVLIDLIFSALMLTVPSACITTIDTGCIFSYTVNMLVFFIFCILCAAERIKLPSTGSTLEIQSAALTLNAAAWVSRGPTNPPPCTVLKFIVLLVIGAMHRRVSDYAAVLCVITTVQQVILTQPGAYHTLKK